MVLVTTITPFLMVILVLVYVVSMVFDVKSIVDLVKIILAGIMVRFLSFDLVFRINRRLFCCRYMY